MDADEFRRIGMRLHRDGLVGANFGNMSVRTQGGFLITVTGTYLDDPGDPVFVPLEGPVPVEVSSEYRVHRQVYQMTSHHALVHAHPPHAVAASLDCDEIIPQDSEGEMFCPVIPVVQGRPGSDEIALNVGKALALSPVVIVRGHGTFAAGRTLDEAYVFTASAEHSCRILWLAGVFRTG